MQKLSKLFENKDSFNLPKKLKSLVSNQNFPHRKLPRFTTTKFSSLIYILFLLISKNFYYSQNITPVSDNYNKQGNTGVNVSTGGVITPVTAPFGNDPNWEVLTSSGWVPAKVVNSSIPNLSACTQSWSGNQTGLPWNQWITSPAFTCGSNSNYSCISGGISDLYFRRVFTLPANPVLHINWSIWASDWVQDISVNGISTPLAYNRGFVNPPTNPSDRQTGVKPASRYENSRRQNFLLDGTRLL